MTPFITLAAAAAIFAQAGQQPAPKATEPAKAPAQQASAVPVVPATPLAVKSVLSARAFTLDQGYEFDWRAERPVVTTGMLLVLEVDPAAVFPRQTAQPVLYVGNQTAERLNIGYPSGKIVVVVPATVDLATAPIWFGTPGLPEQVTENTIKLEREKADKAGITGAGKAKADAVTTATKLTVTDKVALMVEAAKLIRTYAPDETQLADDISAQPPQQGQSK